MALGNLTIGSAVLFDTNDSGRYIAPSSSIVGESSILQVSKPRQTVRQRADGTLTPAQGCTFNYVSNIQNTTTMVFDHFRVQLAFESDSAVSSDDLQAFLIALSAALTPEIFNKIRNSIR